MDRTERASLARILSVESALRVALAAALLLIAMAVRDVFDGDRITASVRILSLAVIVIVVGLAMRGRADAGRLIALERERDEIARAAAAKFSGILAIAADAIIVIDASHNIIHFNHGAERIFGYNAEEIVGKPLSLLLPPRFRATHHDHVIEFDRSSERARRMGHRRAVSGVRKDGAEFPAEAAISKLDLPGDQRIYTVVLRDITDRKREEDFERFLSHTSSRFARSLDPYSVSEAVRVAAVPTLGDGCFVDLIDDNGVVRRTAHATDPRLMSTMLTLAEEYPVAMRNDPSYVSALRGEPAAVASIIDDEWIVTHGGTADEQRLWKALGPGYLLSVPLRVGERSIGVLTLMDRSSPPARFDNDMRRVIEEFARNAALALENARLYTIARHATNARDEVLSVVSHDLRNPIGAIAMCARILRASPSDDENERAKMLDAITEATGWMQRLIRDLLDVTSIEAGHLAIDRKPASLSTIVHTAATMLSGAINDRSMKLEIDVPQRLPFVRADESRIVQVVANLLGNAIKFSDSGSRIAITASATPEGVLTKVEDSGIGIAPEAQADIFNRFWQASPTPGRGHGLGLAIAHGIVEAHGGRIWVESVPGNGSTFAFLLPVDESTGS